MKDRKGILMTAALVMACLAAVVTTTGTVVTYRRALAEKQADLRSLALREVQAIEAILGHDSTGHSPADHADPTSIKNCPKCSARVALVMHMLRESGNFQSGWGEGVEFVLGFRDADTIRFLLRSRPAEQDGRHGTMEIPWKSALAEPMRLALSGLSGIVEAEDYRGEIVLAAYAPVRLVGWGVVAKIDKTEMHAPFVSAAKTSIIIAVLAILAGLIMLRKRLNPLIQLSQDSEAKALSALAELRSQKYAMDEHSIVAITDPSGKISYANDKFCEISQYSREELIGQDYRIVNSGHHPSAFFAELWQTIAAGQVWQGEVCNRAKDGSLYWVETTIVPFKDEGGRITQYVTIRTKVTERKRAAQKLRESEERVSLLLNSTAEAIYGLDLKGNCTFCNSACLKLLGYSNDAALLGKNMHDLIHHTLPDGTTYPVESCRIYQAFRRGEGTHVDDEVLWRADGSSFAAEYWSYPIRQHGEVVGSVVTFVNITERKRTEQTLSRFRSALDCSADGVFLIDRGSMRFVDVNDTACESVGYSREELLAMGPQDIKPLWTREQLERQFDEIVASENEFGVVETIHRRKDGSTFPVEVFLKPVAGEASPVLVAMARDVSERKQVEQQLIAAREDAEVANKTKSEFLANMSHEIRTPMTAIVGFAENMLDAEQSASERLNCVHTIRRNGEYLIGIINDILDLSKIEAGKMTIELTECKPCHIVAEVASLVRVRADAKGLPCKIEYIGAIPETIQSDPLRLRQILINLIGNAIKFTEVGAVRLVTRLVDHGEAQYLQFDVIDTGRGMSEEQVARLFQPFTQADSSTTRQFGGTGLGLTISKRFAELLGGDLTVVATETSVGTTFRATVVTGPLDGVNMLEDPMSATVEADAAGAVGKVSQTDLHGCRILLAEDGPDNQRLISFLLKKAGADVTVKENGKLALDAALAARDEDSGGVGFDCILMDMQMPVMDGYEATGQLRQKGYTGPIIALTAHAMASDREKCISTGCDDYVAKPIDRAKLIATIRQHLVVAEVVSPAAT